MNGYLEPQSHMNYFCHARRLPINEAPYAEGACPKGFRRQERQGKDK